MKFQSIPQGRAPLGRSIYVIVEMTLDVRQNRLHSKSDPTPRRVYKSIIQGFLMIAELKQALTNVVTVINKHRTEGWKSVDMARIASLLAEETPCKTELYCGLRATITLGKTLEHLMSAEDHKVLRYAQADLYAGIEDNGVDLDVEFDDELKKTLDAFALRHNLSLNQVVQDALSLFVSGKSFAQRALEVPVSHP